MQGRRILVIGLLVVLAACGSSSKSTNASSGTTAPPGSTAPQDTSLGTGVTPSTVKIGVALIDFDCIKQFEDNIRLDQPAYYQHFIDDINKNQGGMGGRQVQMVAHTFCPIHPEQAVSGCTQFAEDDKVFAVIGLVYDTTGDVQACFAKQHKTPVMFYETTQSIIDKSPPGMIIFPGTVPERADAVLAKLVKGHGDLNGKKIAILGSTANKSSIEKYVTPALKTIGIPMGTTALLNVGSTGDTTQAQSQLTSFIERWKTEGVNAIFITGVDVVSKQFVEKLKQEMPDVQLVTDVSDARDPARQETAAGKNPNPYQGMISIAGQTPAEADVSPNWQYCAKIYNAWTNRPPAPNGQQIEAPGAAAVLKSKDGKNTIDIHGSIGDACQMTATLKQILDRIGKPLNTTNWVNTVNTFGPIVNRDGGEFSSLHQGHYDIDDTFRLVDFDTATNDWKALTPLENAG
jgi:ABC-type branched-subunit amino acid transport system substrate-binding protein